MRISLRLIFISLAILLVALACRFTPIQAVPAIYSPEPAVTVAVNPPGTDGPLANEETLVTLFEQANPGVVAIRLLTTEGGLGSGFVIDQEGHIVTNFHVVEGIDTVEVDFPSGVKTYGKVVGTDTDSDLAVVKVNIPANELHPLPLGDSSQVKVGQTVVAIGNPFGLDSTMTIGIVSAIGRTLESLHTAPGGQLYTAAELIQTDAAINPGNSGGPLLNLQGEVIGVNRAIRTTNYNLDGEPTNTGIGFAVSSNIVRRVVPVLINEGTYDYPYLGISSLSEITLVQQEALNLDRAVGAYITYIVPGGPAEQAGLRAGDQDTNIQGLYAGGDLIIAVDDHPVRIFNDLVAYLILNTNPGDEVTLTIIRDGKEVSLPLTLGARP